MAMVPSDVLMPDHRLEHLLRQSLRYQQDASLFPYTHSTRLSLTDDLAFDAAKLPALCAELKYHSDEVWVCKFSPSGTWLATAGMDRSLAISVLCPTACYTSLSLLQHHWQARTAPLPSGPPKPCRKVTGAGYGHTGVAATAQTA